MYASTDMYFSVWTMCNIVLCLCVCLHSVYISLQVFSVKSVRAKKSCRIVHRAARRSSFWRMRENMSTVWNVTFTLSSLGYTNKKLDLSPQYLTKDSWCVLWKWIKIHHLYFIYWKKKDNIIIDQKNKNNNLCSCKCSMHVNASLVYMWISNCPEKLDESASFMHIFD